jgi:hypothetical protein
MIMVRSLAAFPVLIQLCLVDGVAIPCCVKGEEKRRRTALREARIAFLEEEVPALVARRVDVETIKYEPTLVARLCSTGGRDAVDVANAPLGAGPCWRLYCA